MKSNLLYASFFFLFLLSGNSFSQVPAAPSNLHAVNVLVSSIRLEWNDNSNNENKFVIERSLDGVNWAVRDSATANNPNFLDIGLVSYARYYYRVYAYNNSGISARSNVASGLTLLSPAECMIGTDTVGTAYPFFTSNTDSRTQMLYKRSEMIGGGCNVMYMWTIAFYYPRITSVTINSFTIKMQNTTDTILTGFRNTGWTTVFNGGQTFYQGWTYINLTNTFIGDPNKNLLIEVCFDLPIALSDNIPLRSSLSPDKVWHRHSNLGSGCSLDSGTSMQYRPNFKIMSIIDGVKKIGGLTVDGYSLEQNYPNPFNGSTKFVFKIKKESAVTLRIYDVMGREELIVFSEPLLPGEYEKTFSLSEHPLASGIYYYCLITGEYTKAKRMVVLK